MADKQTTYRAHFNQDLSRALLLLEFANIMEESWNAEADTSISRLWNDVRISAVAMAVGAMDAYLCDAYVDCLTSVLWSYRQGTWKGRLLSSYAKQQLPVGQLLSTSRPVRPKWNFRMAARDLMAKQNMLKLSLIEDRFNAILPKEQRLWPGLMPALMRHGTKRLTGPRSSAEIARLKGPAKSKAEKKAIAAVKTRLGSIVQIRHDWIHNCARPGYGIGTLSHRQASERIGHVGTFVEELDDHLQKHRLA